MKVLVVYDSVFGNTEKVAQALVGTTTEAAVVKVGDVKPEQLQGLKLLFVGSPTRAFRPTEGTSKFLAGLPKGSLNGVKVAAFDTRASLEDTKSGFLKFMVKLFGYAADPIAKKLVRAGGELVAPAEGFLVEGTEGPMKAGELERASTWAKNILLKVL